MTRKAVTIGLCPYTAFFVSENRLLTAAHNVVQESGRVTKVSIRYEAKKVEPVGARLKCRVVAVIPKSDPSGPYNPLEDLAILECSGRDSPNFLHLSTDALPSTAVVVHIIGYPDEVDQEWHEGRHPELEDYKASRNDTHKLLPQVMLKATESKISSVAGGCVSYENLNVSGMSGGCLLYDGEVYGISL